MRVIAGTARSLPLKTPRGTDTRPTTDRIKETLFNMLQADIPGAVFLDLFSGSGGIGIEALSRGAKKAYFVDNSSEAVSCIQKNLIFTKLQDRAIVLRQDACGAVGGIREENVDIIFLDPPYHSGLERSVLAMLAGTPYVTESTLMIVEASLDTDFSWLEEYGFYLEKDKRYKTNRHAFIRRNFRSDKKVPFKAL